MLGVNSGIHTAAELLRAFPQEYQEIVLHGNLNFYYHCYFTYQGIAI